MVDVGHAPIDVADGGGAVEGPTDEGVHGARTVDLAHPVIGVGPNAEAVEGVHEDPGEVPGVRVMTVTGGIGHVRQRHAHGALDGIGRQERLGIHRVEIVDAVAELHRDVRPTKRAGNGVDHHRTTQASDVNGARRRLRVVDDLRAGSRRGELVSPEHAAQPMRTSVYSMAPAGA